MPPKAKTPPKHDRPNTLIVSLTDEIREALEEIADEDAVAIHQKRNLSWSIRMLIMTERIERRKAKGPP